MNSSVKRLVRLFILIAFVIEHSELKGQSVLSASGGSLQNTSIQVSFTVGEPVVTALLDGNFIYTIGFQQPDYQTVLTKRVDQEWKVKVFPNPFFYGFQLVTEREIRSIRILNSFGKVVYHSGVSSTAFDFDNFDLSSGVYSLEIYFFYGDCFKSKIVKL